MRLRRLKPPESAAAAVNATPLIDVVLCMIIFFLIVGRLAETQRAPMILPESVAGAPDMPPDSLVINLLDSPADDAPISLLLDDRAAAIDDVEPALRDRLARQPNVVVQLRAPRDTPYSRIEPILEACSRAGVADVRLATERVEQEGAAR